MAVLSEIIHDFPQVSSLLNVDKITWNWQRTPPSLSFPLHHSWSSFPLILCHLSSSVEVVLLSIPCAPRYFCLFLQAFYFSLYLCLSFSYFYRLSSLYNELLTLGAQDDMGVATFCHNMCPILQHPLRKLSITKILQVQYCFLNLKLDGD